MPMVWDGIPLLRRSRIRARVSIGKRVPLNERALPAGDSIPLSEEEQKFRAEEGQSHVYAVMDDHFTAEPIQVDGAPFHGAVISASTYGILSCGCVL